jgi:hypothetical protein
VAYRLRLQLGRDVTQRSAMTIQPHAQLAAARAAAPYCHARLSSTELSGPSGGPASVQSTKKIDISDLNDEELDILERALQKTIALQEEC